MTSEHPTARLDIDLNALLHNFHALQKRCPGAEIAPVVKADAYGLGMATIAPHLAKHGARTFFVARLDEGIALRKRLPEAVIYVLDGFTGDLQAFFTHRLRPVLNSLAQYRLWHDGQSLPAALHMDTGMNRLGLRVDELAALPAAPAPALLISHLACGDTPDHPENARQSAAFRTLTTRFSGVPRSLANSAGAFLGEAYRFDLVRPGISLYGGGPFGTPHPELHPIAHLSARILQVRALKKGETVGYGATFTEPHDMQLATLGIGYADGLLRSFAERGFVTVNGQRRRLTGRISMDVCSIDVTGLDVQAGEWVEILGDSQTVDEVAAASGTIAYEWLTRLGPRIPRTYRT
ncbi:alanine racemase [Asticcacaulis sp. EMRT-3]|uniref:alanine racemase n=1 Tax=Asticcacaulis sp. EMRT-3 TaxID=3040349 RepID=UPI0024AF3137|nr:alanine racemase [Asticcacaulis sp. EMRT-3]MDI7774640.1 alanine racemase [Asticcacaulis sp. EMRT-3]